MLEHPNLIPSPTRDLRLAVDVVVVGSGAGGAVMASELAEAGLEVLILEKGGAWQGRDFDQREATMMPLLYEDGGARTTQDGGITVLHASCVGGTTVVNNAICFDPPEFVRREWAERNGVKGLFDAAFARDVAKVNFVLNVNTLTDAELNRNAQLMKLGTEKLGLRGAAFRHNRTGCTSSGFCMLGCSYDFKQSMLVTYVPRALHFGARLLPFAQVERLVASKRQVVAAEGSVLNPQTGQRHHFRIEAQRFVVAGGGISTPLLLLKSELANSSGQVGKNLRLHPLAPLFARFATEVRGYEGIPQGYYVDQFLESRGFLLESIFTHPGVAAATIPGFGADFRRLMTDLNHFAAGYVQVRDEGSGRVSVAPDGGPRIDYQLAAPDAAKIREGYRHLARLFLAAGAEAVHVPHTALAIIRTPDEVDRVIDGLDLASCRLSLMSAHQMGTAAMGEDPDRHVVDSHLRAHDLDNLLVSDASVFPTPSGVNPQITIAALATHAARAEIAQARGASRS